MNHAEFNTRAQEFLSKLFQELELARVALLPHWDIDHICYRTASVDEYQRLKFEFTQFAELLVETPVGGRSIATFRLHQPLRFAGQRIDLVELPAPKKTKPTLTGFEHIEVVCDVPFDELIKRYAHCRFDKKGLDKDFNQELELCLGERNLKFHHASLNSVIALESNRLVWDSLMNSHLLSEWAEYSPLVAGTYPLQLAVEHSDVDLLLYTDDLAGLAQKLTAKGFKNALHTVDQLATLIGEREFQGVKYEVFAQNCPSVEQKAYRHFQVEERLLKYGGESLRKAVQVARRRGLKTELAFAEVLGIPGDPYSTLLAWQRLSASELVAQLTQHGFHAD